MVIYIIYLKVCKYTRVQAYICIIFEVNSFADHFIANTYMCARVCVPLSGANTFYKHICKAENIFQVLRKYTHVQAAI